MNGIVIYGKNLFLVTRLCKIFLANWLACSTSIHHTMILPFTVRPTYMCVHFSCFPFTLKMATCNMC
jgi:hypothetical protein